MSLHIINFELVISHYIATKADLTQFFSRESHACTRLKVQQMSKFRMKDGNGDVKNLNEHNQIPMQVSDKIRK